MAFDMSDMENWFHERLARLEASVLGADHADAIAASNPKNAEQAANNDAALGVTDPGDAVKDASAPSDPSTPAAKGGK